MEFLQQRTYAEEVRKILEFSVSRGDDLFISLGSFYTITYLTERYLKAEQSLSKDDRISRLRLILNGVLNMFMIVGHNHGSIYAGVNDALFDDLEDSYQAHIADSIGCDVLLTINVRHFMKFASVSSLKVLSPKEFVEQHV